jgi:transposase-like protein
VSLSTRRHSAPLSRSAFAGCRFPAEVITVAVRWYLRYGLSYRDVEELLAERMVEVDHVTVYRWVQRFAPLFADVARFARHSPGDRWFVDETYVKVGGVWRYVYRAVDQHGQVIDILVSKHRDAEAARRFFRRALATLKVTPTEVVIDAAPVFPRVLDELVPVAWRHVEQYVNNRIEADHSRLKQRLRPTRGLRTDRTAGVIIAGTAFMRNVRRGHYELATDRSRFAAPPRSPNSPERSKNGSPRAPRRPPISECNRATSADAPPKAKPAAKPSAASSATSPARSTGSSDNSTSTNGPREWLDKHRGINAELAAQGRQRHREQHALGYGGRDPLGVRVGGPFCL